MHCQKRKISRYINYDLEFSSDYSDEEVSGEETDYTVSPKHEIQTNMTSLFSSGVAFLGMLLSSFGLFFSIYVSGMLIWHFSPETSCHC